MIRVRALRLRQRLLVGLLAVWIAVFAVAASVHNHGQPGPTALRAAPHGSDVGQGRGDTCLACLVSHIPVPVPENATSVVASWEPQGLDRFEPFRPVPVVSHLPSPSRAPPAVRSIA